MQYHIYISIIVANTKIRYTYICSSQCDAGDSSLYSTDTCHVI